MLKIYAYYEDVLVDFSVSDLTHTQHYLLEILENMKRLDAEHAGDETDTPRG